VFFSRNLAREKKEKVGANFQRYKGYLWGKFCAQVLTLQGKYLENRFQQIAKL
jgi:hypothetical protein